MLYDNWTMPLPSVLQDQILPMNARKGGKFPSNRTKSRLVAVGEAGEGDEGRRGNGFSVSSFFSRTIFSYAS